MGDMARATNTQFAVAVHVLTYLADDDQHGAVSSDDLAASADVNPVHVRRLLGPLRAAGIVRSRPGPHGGWELAARPEDISLGHIWRLLQGDDSLLGLHSPSSDCPVGRGVQPFLVELDRGVTHAVEIELGRTTVLDVLVRSGLTGAQVSRSVEVTDDLAPG